MLYAWGFDRVGVVAGDLYFVDPDPGPGQEGAERGVRVEVRLMGKPPLTGTIYSVQPIVIDRPVWRADLLESVAGPVGSHDRTHHHPNVRGWEVGRRKFEDGLTSDPMGWLTAKLCDLPAMLADAELDPDEVGPDDARQMAETAPAIASTVADVLARVRRGELAKVPAEPVDSARISWL